MNWFILGDFHVSGKRYSKLNEIFSNVFFSRVTEGELTKAEGLSTTTTIALSLTNNFQLINETDSDLLTLHS